MEAKDMDPNSNTINKVDILFNILYSMVPLIGFWLVEKYWGLLPGVVCAIILSLLEVVWGLIKEKRIEFFALFSCILVIIMGYLSWKLHTTIILRLKPAIIEGIFALLFIGSSLINKPFMLILAKKQFKNRELDELQYNYLSRVNLRIGVLFLLHTLITIYAALYLSMSQWIFVKGILFYIIFIVYFIYEFIYMKYFYFKKILEKREIEKAFIEYQRNIIYNIKNRNFDKKDK